MITNGMKQKPWYKDWLETKLSLLCHDKERDYAYIGEVIGELLRTEGKDKVLEILKDEF